MNAKTVRFATLASCLLLTASLINSAPVHADADPYPGVGDRNRIPGGPTLSGTRDDPSPSGDALGCPAHTGAALAVNATDGRWEMYCIKTWVAQAQINDEANRAAAEQNARAEAEAEAARTPGVQVCKTWSYTYSNGVTAASGGVCVVVPVLTEGVDIPTPEPTATPTPTRPTNPDTTREPWYLYEPNYVPGSCGLTAAVSGNGYQYTRPFSAQECAQRDIDSLAWSAQAQARERAQREASRQPGIRFCTPWSAAGQSGQECAFESLRGADQAPISVEVTPIIADPQVPLNVTPSWQQYAPGIVVGACGLTTTQSGPGYSYTRPFSEDECAQRAKDQAADTARRAAELTAEAAARRTPGVEFCTPWSAGEQSGRVCRTRPIGLDTILATSESESDAQINYESTEADDPTLALSMLAQITQSTVPVVRSQIASIETDPAMRVALRKHVKSMAKQIPAKFTGRKLTLPRSTQKISNSWFTETPKVCKITKPRTLKFIKSGTCIVGLKFNAKDGNTYLLGHKVTYSKRGETTPAT